MNYFSYLKKGALFYVLCGVAAGIALFSAILITRYSVHLENLLASLNSLSVNKAKVKKEIDTVDSLAGYFHDRYGITIDKTNSSSLLFQALDEMKSNLPGAALSVSDLKKEGDLRKLPVSVEANMKSFSMVLDYIQYVETRKMPAFRINNITLARGQHEVIILSVDGEFVMPSTGSDA